MASLVFCCTILNLALKGAILFKNLKISVQNSEYYSLLENISTHLKCLSNQNTIGLDFTKEGYAGQIAGLKYE